MLALEDDNQFTNVAGKSTICNWLHSSLLRPHTTMSHSIQLCPYQCAQCWWTAEIIWESYSDGWSLGQKTQLCRLTQTGSAASPAASGMRLAHCGCPHSSSLWEEMLITKAQLSGGHWLHLLLKDSSTTELTGKKGVTPSLCCSVRPFFFLSFYPLQSVCAAHSHHTRSLKSTGSKSKECLGKIQHAHRLWFHIIKHLETEWATKSAKSYNSRAALLFLVFLFFFTWRKT